MADLHTENRETVVVDRDNHSGSSAGAIVAILAVIVLLLLALYFIGNPFSSSDSGDTNINVNPPAATESVTE